MDSLKKQLTQHSSLTTVHQLTLNSHIIDASLKCRARLLITNSSIPRQTRSLIRYALETKDPYLAQVVRRVQGGEVTIEFLYRERNEVSIPTSRDSGWVRSLGSGRAKTRRRIV